MRMIHSVAIVVAFMLFFAGNATADYYRCLADCLVVTHFPRSTSTYFKNCLRVCAPMSHIRRGSSGVV
ncbi:hypothetical protein SLEP1_g60382 [Rubroshorea leprosula]|uniref:Uncharacterized protein n=1 Tax=Rubroshorea leprosula TaxID=152421 RepID=A0AAV5MXR9_9ROSI|nr:hypothetical protein SLEP1_g56537 [Rubroshorea leprosula]GKV53869.1 hypothetical protein SLEP1_g60382 [Rubroshorea leprosula]